MGILQNTFWNGPWKHVGATGQNDSCNRYTGYYSLPLNVFVNNRRGGVGVRCECPEKKDHLDRNCRYVPPCQNSGYRSFSINLRCVCPPGWFGELCEKYCYTGTLVKVKGLDTCICKPYFYGEECNKVQCFHGGTPVSGHGCICQLPYLGKHCEVKLNASLHYSRHETVLTRDISGSIISLLLVVGLSVLVYLLIRRKTQVLTRRRLAVRNFLGVGRPYHENAAELNLANLQFTGPPPYTTNIAPPRGPPGYMVPLSGGAAMPPLPSYDDAIKLPSGQSGPENQATEPPNFSEVAEQTEGSSAFDNEEEAGENGFGNSGADEAEVSNSGETNRDNLESANVSESLQEQIDSQTTIIPTVVSDH